MAEKEPDPMDFSLAQQRFMLSVMANAAGKFPGNRQFLENHIRDKITEYLPQMAGKWELTWGPTVYKGDDKSEDTPPLNAWFVATSGERSESVLAIAGTAPKSKAGWVQDFNVGKVINWNDWIAAWPNAGHVTKLPNSPLFPTKGNAYIALGTAQGTFNVLDTLSDQIGSGTRVSEYLGGPSSGSQIYVTGHSMGGALSPVVALGLVKGTLAKDKEVEVLPSAGASPGNIYFGDLWASQFNGANFYNTLDPVPQAWSHDKSQDRNLYNIMGNIFEGQGGNPNLQKARDAVGGAVLLSERSMVKYRGISGSPFTNDVPIPIVAEKGKENDLASIVLEQHVTAYLKAYNVRSFAERFSKDLETSLGLSGDWDSGDPFGEEALRDMDEQLRELEESRKGEEAPAES